MDIQMSFGRAAHFRLRAEDMSAKGQEEYLAEWRKTRETEASRLELERQAGKLANLPSADAAALANLLCRHGDCSEITLFHIRQMRDPGAKRLAAALVDINLQEAQARRMMAIIARDEFYDAELREAEENRKALARQRQELAAQAPYDRRAANMLEFQKPLFSHDPVQTCLLYLRAFDGDFLKDFNGPMLDTIRNLKEAQAHLSATAISASPDPAQAAHKAAPRLATA